MGKQSATSEKTRFDAKLTKAQKDLFESAARLGGFRTLTDFVISTVQERAKEIVEEHNAILASEKDAEVFFDALMKPPVANEALRKAAARHKELSESLKNHE